MGNHVNHWSDLSFFEKQYPSIKKFLAEQANEGKLILPPKGWIFNAFLCTPRDKVKVIILGQDPYPNPDYAMGLAFSVPTDVDVLPPSLENIQKELYEDLGIRRHHGSLMDWTRQGVLLLNTSLTVEAGRSNSHAYIGWNELVKEVLETVSIEQDGLVFILWGANAQAYRPHIKNPKNHMIIQSAHPSPLSADRGFFGSKPFSKANFFLESVGKLPIRWG